MDWVRDDSKYRQETVLYYSRQYYVWSHTYSKGMDQSGKVANSARDQLNRENEYSPIPVRA